MSPANRGVRGGMNRPEMPHASAPAPITTDERPSRQRLPGRTRLTADFPVEDKQALEDWAHTSDTSATALLVSMFRLVRSTPALRTKVQAAAEEYALAQRSRKPPSTTTAKRPS